MWKAYVRAGRPASTVDDLELAEFPVDALSANVQRATSTAESDSREADSGMWGWLTSNARAEGSGAWNIVSTKPRN